MSDALQFSALFLGIVLFTQIGTRRHTLFRAVTPFVTAGVVGSIVVFTGQHHYQLPADAVTGIAGAVVGAAVGVGLTAAMRVFWRDGRLYVKAGWVYLALWLVVLVGRLVFVWLLENDHAFAMDIGKFMAHNGIGPDGVMLFFVLMALAMSVTREIGVQLVKPRSAARSASIFSNSSSGSDTTSGNRPNTSSVT